MASRVNATVPVFATCHFLSSIPGQNDKPVRGDYDRRREAEAVHAKELGIYPIAIALNEGVDPILVDVAVENSIHRPGRGSPIR